MDKGKVAVVGTGVMGAGIAQVAAMHGHSVFLFDVAETQLSKAMDTVGWSLGKLVKSERISDEAAGGALSCLHPTTDLGSAVQDAAWVVEAVPEKLETKHNVFRQLDQLAPPEAVLMTNTSQFSITSIAAATTRPEHVIGTHWFAPPVLMKLVEIVPGQRTLQSVTEATVGLVRSLDKEPITLNKDQQGFVTSRANMALFAECFRIYEEGVASPEEIDKALRLGLGHSMGIFEVSDLSGNDTVLLAMSSLAEAYGDRFKPSPCLVRMVAAGYLGQKVGRGWFEYDQGRKKRG